MFRFLFSTILLLFCAYGCDNSRIFEEYRPVKDHQWLHKDTITYQVNIQDTNSHYNIYLNLRNKINYPYRNIWLLFKTVGPDNQTSKSKMNFKLANKKGQWLGQGLGDIYDHRYRISKKAKFRHLGNHTFRINHLMRKDTLPGIMNVGLRLEKAE